MTYHNLIPRRLRPLLQKALISYPHRVECNLCGWRGRRFLSDSWHPYTVCPRCASEVRHRLLVAALTQLDSVSLQRIVKGKEVLHFAPEQSLRSLFSSQAGRYLSADFQREDVDLALDISAMREIADDALDLVVACDVLEHVPDDRLAIREIYRVLRPGGYAILTVPQQDGLKETFEDPTVTDPLSREQIFGQSDHLRIYGSDFAPLLEAAGFAVTAVSEASFPQGRARRHVLYPPVLSGHPLATNYRKVFFARKSSRDGGEPRLTISAVTPSYNQGDFIETTILSVKEQSFPALEHIVIDGGSTDGTLEILKRHPHLNWVSEPDRGQGDALNKGLRQAQGDVIAWINSDDWYEPGAFLAVARFFAENPDKHVVMGDCHLVREDGERFDLAVNQERGLEELRQFWVGGAIPTQPAIFFRRELLERFGYLDETLHYAMDYDLWLRFARENRFYHIDVPVANYRFHRAAKGGDGDWLKFVPEWQLVCERHGHPAPDLATVTESVRGKKEGVTARLLRSCRFRRASG